MKVTITSFGFKGGVPPTAGFIIDCRGIKNPHRNRQLRYLNGLDPAVAEEVLSTPQGRMAVVSGLELMRRQAAEGRQTLSLVVGCTGGRHRSVAVAEAMATQAMAIGHEVTVVHRDLRQP